MRVFWDSELAGIAKLITSTCIKSHQYTCAATAKFPNPVMAYLHLNITGQPAFLDPEPLIESLLQVWLNAKEQVSAAMIQKCPSFKSGIARRHIKMLMDNLTHIGCAFGVYFVTRHTKAAHLICYLSYWKPEGEPVYATEPPSPGSGYSEECGCPPRYRESQDCLCVAGPRTPHKIMPTQKLTDVISRAQSNLPFFDLEQKCGNTSSKQKIIMLPLFKLVDVTEDAHEKKTEYKDKTLYRSVINNSFTTNHYEQKEENVDALFISSENTEESKVSPIKKTIASELLHNVNKLKKQREIVVTKATTTSKPLIEEATTTKKPLIEAPLSSDEATCPIENGIKNPEKLQVMNLLDALIEKGKNVDLNSGEIGKFEAKMRRIYQSAFRKKITSNDNQIN
uniref:SCP domain-containing protein n=1 Tax=Heliothis virescens TaxID=7102 RepID=A0A2A4JTM5_HELVI